jgi:hypothetical protein
MQIMKIARMRLLVSAGLLIVIGEAFAQPIQGRVISVADGDTITAQTEDKRRVRPVDTSFGRRAVLVVSHGFQQATATASRANR